MGTGGDSMNTEMQDTLYIQNKTIVEIGEARFKLLYEKEIMIAALDKLARLGNGERFGNSEGNCIALDALRKVLPEHYGEEII